MVLLLEEVYQEGGCHPCAGEWAFACVERQQGHPGCHTFKIAPAWQGLRAQTRT